MSAGLIGILSVGPALAALELSGRLTMDRRITGLEARLDERMSGPEAGLDWRMAGPEGRIVETVGRFPDTDRRSPRVEGLLVGLALSGRIDVPPAEN
ncbi:MAG: hypothetical protein OXH99_07355 [Bryobacterales bacterium]|nr:hypothetical protein [Bryobacterales bacterium]